MQTDTEKKLKLLSQIRSRYNRDMEDLSVRERILYGVDDSLTQADASEEKGSFSMRLLLAFLLVLAYILCDINQFSYRGITTAVCREYIAVDLKDSLIQRIDAVSVSSNDLQAP